MHAGPWGPRRAGQGTAGRGGQRLSHTAPDPTPRSLLPSEGLEDRLGLPCLPPAPTFSPAPAAPSGEAAREGREEGGAAPRPPPGSCREGDARCHFPSSPRTAPCPPPAPAAGGAPSPGAAPRAPHRQQAGPRRRPPASALPPAPRHGRALRGAAPPRLGSARLCPAAGLGSARLHANGPERHGQIASQPGAGGADGAAGQPPARGGNAGRAGAARPGGTAGIGSREGRRGAAGARPSAWAPRSEKFGTRSAAGPRDARAERSRRLSGGWMGGTRCARAWRAVSARSRPGSPPR